MIPMKLNTTLAILALTACFAGPDHESLGDQAYAVGEFAGALVEYRLALRQEAPNDILRAKAAQSAYNASDLVAAAEEGVEAKNTTGAHDNKCPLPHG